MRTFAVATIGSVALCAGLTLEEHRPGPAMALAHEPARIDSFPAEVVNTLVRNYCWACHNEVSLTGNLDLGGFDLDAAVTGRPEVIEKMIKKLRAGMMPAPGAARPTPDTLQAMVETLETTVDAYAARHPDPGTRTFQRLNRAEYERSVRDLLNISVTAGDYLPLDTKSANFDNIADVQMLSPTLIGAYMRAAADISRLAVGDPGASPSEATYQVSRWISQREQVEGAPFGTRGGVSVIHNFPADGEYLFRVSFHHETTGTLFGNGRAALHTAAKPEQVEISVDGERKALLDIDRWMHASDPNGVNIRAVEPIFIAAGPHRVTAAFLRRFEGPEQDMISPHEWSLASTAVAGAYGVTSLPHLRDMAFAGPYNVTGVSDTPSRQSIFSCRPAAANDEAPCARQIVARLGSRAYRRPLEGDEADDLFAFYASTASTDGFEAGIRSALEAILASPHFVFRLEEVPAGLSAGEFYRISDNDLAARLSFFLWATPPDQELSGVAARGELTRPGMLEQQVQRMLADPRAEALSTRFAAQWLRLQDLDKIHPDVRIHPDFDEQLRQAMREETQLFFNSIVQEDRSIFDLFDADYTFVNQRLARHYGIPNVSGAGFSRVRMEDETRRGLLGHGSILTLTSHAGRTSPVLRGKWVMEVLLGTPPPPPPPGVPDLEATEGRQDGRPLTTRERMEMHRASPVCRSCHLFMDPIGLALDNFDITGRWRIKENSQPLDTRGQLYDGTPVASPSDLRAALLSRPIPLLRTFTENLFAYALGRRVEHYDMPTVRQIVKDAEASDYHISAFILGVVKSPAFQMSRDDAVAATSPESH